MREVSLQKVYGMGQTEAEYWAERESGLSMEDSARLHGVSYYTVRSMLQRAKMKVTGKDGGWDTLLIVLKGTEGNVSDAVKVPAMLCIMTFASKVWGGTPIHEGRHLFAMPMARGSGDIAWMNEYVFRLCDPVGSVLQDVERVSDRMYRLYTEAGGTPDRMGLGVIQYWLDKWMMRYDIWTVEDDE